MSVEQIASNTTNNIINENKYNHSILNKTGCESVGEAIQKAKKQRDYFEYVGMEKTYFCEQYNEFGSKLVKSGSVRLSISSDMQKDMLGCLEGYYEGKLSEKELKDAYIGYCEEAGTDNQTRLLDVYENFINMSRYAANNVCSRKGNEITEQYGSVEDHDVVYYNADFYYAFEKIKNIVREATAQIAEEVDCGNLKFEEREHNTIFNLDGSFDFNGKWTWNTQNMINRCTMINSDEIPPEGFEFYYKERKYKDSEVGIMLLGTKQGYKEVMVPFEAPKAGIAEYVQKFNAAELFRFSETDTDAVEEYNSFLSNFDIYTRYHFAKNESDILN